MNEFEKWYSQNQKGAWDRKLVKAAYIAGLRHAAEIARKDRLYSADADAIESTATQIEKGE